MKTLIPFEPLLDFERMNAVMDRLFNKPISANTPSLIATPIDVFEQDGKMIVRAAIPGVEPDHVDVQLDNGVLTIRGEMSREETSENAKIYRREIATGSFSRSIRLPENLDFEKVDATFSNGVVTITVPYFEEVKAQPKRIPIRTQTNES